MWMQMETAMKWLENKEKFEPLEKAHQKSKSWKGRKGVTVKGGSTPLAGHGTSGDIVNTLTTMRDLVEFDFSSGAAGTINRIGLITEWLVACYKIDTASKYIPEFKKIISLNDSMYSELVSKTKNLPKTLTVIFNKPECEDLPDRLVQLSERSSSDSPIRELYLNPRIKEIMYRGPSGKTDLLIDPKDIPTIIKLIEEASNADYTKQERKNLSDERIVSTKLRDLLEKRYELAKTPNSTTREFKCLCEIGSSAYVDMKNRIAQTNTDLKYYPTNMKSPLASWLATRYITMLRDSAVLIEHADSWFKSSNVD